MPDIVERLKIGHAYKEIPDGIGGVTIWPTLQNYEVDGIMCEAAASIESLRLEHATAMSEIAKLLFENEKFRDDLTQARAALIPFANCVFADNEDVTIDTSKLPTGAWKRAVRLTTFEDRETARTASHDLDAVHKALKAEKGHAAEAIRKVLGLGDAR